MLSEAIRSVFRNRLLRVGLVAVALMAIAATVVWALDIGTYDQCSNDLGDGYGPPDVGCRWINGNLNGNNSSYPEDDATVQRVWLTQLLPDTEYSITLKYGTTKGGHHAYDFLTTWDWSESWITEADLCQGIPGCEQDLANPAALIIDYLDIPQDPNAPDTFEPNVAGSRMFLMHGGTLVSATTPVIVSGDYTSDSETVIHVTFRTPTGGQMCPVSNKGVTLCDVALWFGAHVAFTDDWFAYNGTTGAATIPGSPYHVALDAINGEAVGQRDNQMQTSAVAVAFESLSATAQADGVAVAWETVSEVDSAGFNVYRAASADGPWTKVNAALIAAAAPGSTAGHAYSWVDASAVAGTTYWYQLEEVALSGTAVLYAPVMVSQAEPNSVQVVGLSATALNAVAPLGALGVALLSGLALARRRR